MSAGQQQQKEIAEAPARKLGDKMLEASITLNKVGPGDEMPQIKSQFSSAAANLRPTTTISGANQRQQQQSSINIKNKNKTTASSGGSKMTMAQVNLSGNMSKQQQKQLTESLRAAANEGKAELVRLLLRCGADVNRQDDEFGNTALHQAAWNGFSETIQVLCKHRANTSIRNKAQFAPLHLACQQGHNQSARLLLMAGAKADAKNSYGDTALHTAARYGHAGVARICLSARADPNQVNKNNDTPLHIAAAMGRRKLTKILMQHGAEPAIKNKQLETAMDIALRKDLIEIQELIANPPASSSNKRRKATALTTAAETAIIRDSQLELNQLVGGANCAQQQQQRALLCSQLYSSSRLPPPAHGLQLGRNVHHHRHNKRHAHRTGRKHRHFRSQHDFCHNEPTMSDNDEGEGEASDQNDDFITKARQQLELRRTANRSVEPTARMRVRETTPVDAGPQWKHFNGGARGKSQLFASESALNSRACDEMMGLKLIGQQAQNNLKNAQAQRRLRTRTLANGLNLNHQLDQTQKGATFVIRPSSVGSIRKPLSEQLADLKLTNDEGEQSEEGEEEQLRLDKQNVASQKRKLGARFHSRRRNNLRSSPTGSVRSSQVSRSRGRLVIKPRRLTIASGASQQATNVMKQQGGGGDLQTTDNARNKQRRLTSCVSRLSLLQLRNMVNSKTNNNKKATAAAAAPAGELNNDEVMQQQAEGEEESSQEGGVFELATSGGRRQQRLEQQQQQQASASLGDRCLMRAPNGAKLLATRPLAPLHDDTQLYAIPRKSSKATTALKTQPAPDEQKQQVASEQAATAAATCKLAHFANDKAALCVLSARREIASEAPSGEAGECQQSRQEQRTIKTTTTTTLDLVKRAASLAAGGKQAATAAPTQQVAGPALTGSDSGHSLSTNSSSSNGLEAPVNASGGDQGAKLPQVHLELERNLKRNQRQQGATSSTTSSCELDSSSSSTASSRECQLNESTRNNGRLEQQQQEIVVGELLEDERDFCAPGYSIVRARGTSGGEEEEEAEDTCRCPLGSETQQAGAGLLLREVRPEAQSHDERERDELIRPKSALGIASAQSIAAQKSLAAAAAAKVHRDRLAKATAAAAAANCRPLIVNTTTETPCNLVSEQINAFWLQSRQQQPTTTTAAAVAQMNNHYRACQNGQSAVGATSVACAGSGVQRSGTNSAGLTSSDSSPSNNGADSDNSTQTTNDSLTNSTGTTTAAVDDEPNGQEQQQQASIAANCSKNGKSSFPSGPFGILSRILLNNSKQQQQQQQQQSSGKLKAVSTKHVVASKPTLRNSASVMNNCGSRFSGSISSSSAMSSPSISTNGGATITISSATSQSSPDDSTSSTTLMSSGVAESPGKLQVHQANGLDQLSSRSRQPIVLTNSNELEARSTPTSNGHQSIFNHKGVLEKHKQCQDEDEDFWNCKPSSNQQQRPDALASGLPRVASYTHLTGQSPLISKEQARINLCNYHALNRSHMIQAKYSPYLPYNLGRYSIHETCDPSSAATAAAAELYGQPNLGGYFNPANHHHHQLAYPYDNNCSLNSNGDVSMVCNYSRLEHEHEQSVYIAPYKHADQQHNFHNNNPTTTTLVDYQNQSRPPVQQQRRPRSSLDSMLCVSSATAAASSNQDLHHHHQHLTYGQSQQVCNGQVAAIPPRPGRPILIKRPTAAATNELVLKNHAASEQRDSSHFTHVTQNSIYASQSMLPPRSELTVLPANSSLTVKRQELDNGDDDQENTATNMTSATIATTSSNHQAKHKSFVQVNQQLFERSTPPALPPKTGAALGKLTTRVSIGKDWTQVEAGGKQSSRAETSGQNYDDFTGSTVL